MQSNSLPDALVGGRGQRVRGIDSIIYHASIRREWVQSDTSGDFRVGARKRRKRSIRTSPEVAIASRRKNYNAKRNRNRVHRRC